MAGLQVHTDVGELKINSVSLHTAAWKLLDITSLFFDSPLRGQYVVIPGADGESPVPVRQTAAQWSLEMVIIGAYDRTGAAYSNKWQGLASNINYLRSNVLTGRTLTGNRTRAATLTVPGEVSDRTADVHCWITPGKSIGNAQMMATFELHIPAGAFV